MGIQARDAAKIDHGPRVAPREAQGVSHAAWGNDHLSLLAIHLSRIVAATAVTIISSVGGDNVPLTVRPAPEGNQEAIMRRMLLGIAIALSMVPIGATSANAQEIEGVTVTGSRIVKERIGRTPANVPINAISLAYKVSYSDLDLTGSAGKAALEERVSDAALAACKEISRLYPAAKPDDGACAKAAVDEAMVKVREVIAAAGK